MRKLLFFAILFFSIHNILFAQWFQNEDLTGGSIIKDILSFNGDIYIAVEDNGLFRSNDNGDSWTNVDVGHDWSIDRLEIHKNKFFAATSQHLFISGDGIVWEDITIPGTFVNELYSDGENLYLSTLIGGVFKSEDDGLNWIDINDEFTSEGVESFAKVNEILYAAKRDASGTLFKSINDGQTWEQITVENGQWIKEICANSDGLFVSTSDKIFFSSNEGLSWTAISNGLSGRSISNLFIHNNLLYVNSNGSIFTTIDAGANWKGFQHQISGFNASALYVNDNYIFIGFWGGGVGRNTINVDHEWEVKNKGLTLNNIHRIYAQGDTIFAGTEHTFVRSSFDQGLTWNQEENLYASMGIDARYMTVFKHHMYVGSGGYGVMKRRVDGLWEPFNVGLSNNMIQDLCANEKYIFAAVNDDGIFRSTDPAQGWTKKSSGISYGIRKLYSSGEHIFAGTWNGLFVSDNNGESWMDISGDLPGKSINDIIYVDSTIIIATQNNGAFKSSDFGLNWKNISVESINYLVAYKKTIIKGSSPGSLATSADLGETWKIIDDGVFPKAYVTTMGFSSDYIFVGFGRPGPGILQRKLYEIFPPSIADAEKDSVELVLREKEGIVIESDQELTQENGEKLDSASLYPLIKVFDSNFNEIEFEANIDSASKKITIVISLPTDGEKYIVEIDSIQNKSGLRSAKFTSQAFEFHKNHPPLLSDIQKSGFEKQPIIISSTDFIDAIKDTENDPIAFLKIINTPQNGVLYNNSEVIEENTTLTLQDFSNLKYEANLDYVGMDSVIWNSFDGYDFSVDNASIVFRIDAVTGLKEVQRSNITLFPNPANNQIKSIVKNNFSGTYKYILTNINGGVLREFEVIKSKEELDYTISLADLKSGIYFLEISGKGFHTTQKIIKL